jgi:hypothetical protein
MKPSNQLKKFGAIAAIAFPILQMAAQGFFQAGGVEPSFAAPANEILAFFETRDSVLFTIGDYIFILSLILPICGWRWAAWSWRRFS